ncbi:Angio-associated migratory cell protein [Hondaea fermentalgiana]|uniref:Angio-associated migratory cell protein n=1 Tax=Hondaea fermentalgiana TaxID=2315210 RepID=A0A2R5GCM1_9STRA|nr:Angio-associated migratory cell protein [Hondaea fermentalgiana]|eukprot:GBG25514.1 Angio-associated migratory cell protein [Hondaea fermentalgiana]
MDESMDLETNGAAASQQQNQQQGTSTGASASKGDDDVWAVNEDDVEEVDDSKPFVQGQDANDDDDDDDNVELAETTEGEVKVGTDDAEGESQSAEPPQVPADGAAFAFTQHSDSVYCVALSADGSRALSGGGDDTAYLWGTKDGTPVVKLSGHTDTIVDCGFSADGSMCATSGYDAAVRVWNSDTGALVTTLDGPSTEIEWIRWHPSGNVLMGGSEDATIWVWDLTQGPSFGQCLGVLAGHEGSVTCGLFTPNGKRIVTGSLDGTVRLWDPKTWTCAHTFAGHEWHQGGVVSLVCHPSQPMIAAGGVDGTVRLARLETRKIVASFQHDAPKAGAAGEEEVGSVESVDFSDTLPFVASGATDGTVKIWDLNTQTCRQVLRHEDAVVRVRFVPGSPTLISCSADGTTRMWDARSGQQMRVLTHHGNMVLNFAMRPGIFVSCSDDHTCRVVHG